MAACISCQKELNALDVVRALTHKRCGACQKRYSTLQKTLFASLDYAFAHSGVSEQMEQDIYRQIHTEKMPQDLGGPLVTRLVHLRHLTEINAATRYMESSFASDGVSEQVARDIFARFAVCHVPDAMTTQFRERLAYLRQLTDIRWGKLPVVSVNIHLDSDEHGHFDLMATYVKRNKNSNRAIEGRLIGTNKKCYFVSHSGPGSMTMDWNNVLEVTQSQAFVPERGILLTICIRVARGAGGGDYVVSDPLYTKTLMDSLVRLWKRQLVIYQENRNHGPVPDHVKAAVFQRDGGKCVQCGYEGDYIEYDHRIPRSRGGANTVDNIQLLCRKCNLKKSNRL